MKTHKYFSFDAHKNSCPRYNYKNNTGRKCGSMICEDCLIGGFVPSTQYKGAYQYECKLFVFDEQDN